VPMQAISARFIGDHPACTRHGAAARPADHRLARRGGTRKERRHGAD
jgi:hypothetical protein